MTHLIPKLYRISLLLVWWGITSLSLQAQKTIAYSEQDSLRAALTPLDPKINKLLHGDSTKFNYAGTDLLMIDMEKAKTVSHNAPDTTISIGKVAKSSVVSRKNDGSTFQPTSPTDSKMILADALVSTSSDGYYNIKDTSKRVIDKQTTKNKRGVKTKPIIAPLEPIRTTIKDNPSSKVVIIKTLTSRPGNKPSATQSKPSSATSYEASPAADIIGRNKLVQRPVIKYGEDAESKEVIYRARLSALQTIIPMTYNSIVHNFIEMYVYEKRDQVSRMLPRTDRYYTIFEEALDRHGLPMELKYLPVMESALIPHAKSLMGASGLWQLPYSVAKGYGLDSNDFIDERRDPKLATEAAVMHLKNLYRKYLNWQLVIAAYHCGDGEMNKAIQKGGGIRDYWELATFLPIETQAYVPLFIAAVYTMSYYNEHNISKFDAPYTFYSIDTVRIKNAASLRDIAKQVDMDINELQYLNPAIIHDYIPPSTKGYPLTLPVNKTGVLVAHLNNLKNQKEIILDRTREKSISLPTSNAWQYTTDVFGNKISTKGTSPVVKGGGTSPTKNSSKAQTNDVIIAHYVIQKGDNMKRILQMFPGVTIKDIMRVNQLKDGNFERGMMLKIPQAR